MSEPDADIIKGPLWPRYLGFALVVIIVFFTYFPTLSFEFTNWDDPSYVQDNQAIQTPGWMGIKEILSRPIPAGHGDYLPVTILSYWLDYQWWGGEPTGYHLTNILLHALSSGLMFLLLRRLTMRTMASMLVALLFALHPMNTEAVTWVAERKSVMAMFWMLLSFHTFLSWQRGLKTPRGYLYLSLWCYLLACLSKTAVVFFPLIVLAYQICLAKTGLRQSIRGLVPFLLISFFTGMGRLLGHYVSGQMVNNPFENPWVQLLTIFEIFGGYLKTLMIPLNLNHNYPLETSSSLFDPGVWFGLLSMVGMIILAARCLRHYPLICFGLAWYLAAWLPHAQIIAIPPALRADRYVYYSSTGLFLALVFGIEQWVIHGKQVLVKKRIRVMTCVLAFLIVGAFGSLTVLRNKVWCNSISLWRDSAKKHYRNDLTHNNLGKAYVEKGMLDEAITEYQQAIAIDPSNAYAHNNLGVAFDKKGRLHEAISEYKQALNIKPSYADPHYNLGIVYAKKGRLREAISEYKQALIINPHHAEIHYNLGNAHARKDKVGKAISAYKKALTIKPHYAEAHNNLGVTYAKKGRLDEAIAEFKQVLIIKPDHIEAYNNLGYAYFEKGELDKAILEYKHALGINPNYAEAHNNLAVAYYSQGNYKLAIVHGNQAVELKGRVDPKLLELLKPYR